MILYVLTLFYDNPKIPKSYRKMIVRCFVNQAPNLDKWKKGELRLILD